MSESYPKKEMDLKIEAIYSKVDSNHNEVMRELKQHREVHSQLLDQVTFTNGKVKRIIIALVAIGAFSLGVGLKEADVLISLLF